MPEGLNFEATELVGLVAVAAVFLFLIRWWFSRRGTAVESRRANWPKERVIANGSAIELTGSYAAPSPWWSSGFPLLLVLLSMFLLPVSCNATYGGFDNVDGGEAVRFFFGYIVAAFAFAALAEFSGKRKHLSVVISPQHIDINGKRYERRQGLNEFRHEEHDKMRTAPRAQLHHYVESVQVVMRYGERRVVIGSFDRTQIDKADSLLQRLKELSTRELESRLNAEAT